MYSPPMVASQTLFTTKLDKINQPLHYNGSEFKLARRHASASASINGKSSFINFCSGLVHLEWKLIQGKCS